MFWGVARGGAVQGLLFRWRGPVAAPPFDPVGVPVRSATNTSDGSVGGDRRARTSPEDDGRSLGSRAQLLLSTACVPFADDGFLAYLLSLLEVKYCTFLLYSFVLINIYFCKNRKESFPIS